jgi:hypothetical protein
MCKNVTECRYFDPDTGICMLLKKAVRESGDECVKFKNKTWNTDKFERMMSP